jgi:L-threonylcarbamoyladenylate synthase
MPVAVVNPQRPDPAVLAHAAELWRDGKLVAFPTETVYGLGAHALDPQAVARIYEAKGRPAWNPVIVHVASVDAARALTTGWSPQADALAEHFWPGPLTLVLPRISAIPDAVTAGLDTVGLRVPSHPVALALLEASGLPIAAPSANRFTELSPTSAAHVERTLGDRVDLIVDGGPATVGIESTVLDISGAVPRLLRPGGISVDALEAVIGPIARPDRDLTGDTARPAPGMMEKHYAPRARMLLVTPRTADAAWAEAAAARARGQVVGVLTLGGLNGAADLTVRMPSDATGYARRLYAVLHDLDAEGCALVLAEAPATDATWAGVTDRLQRASSA